MKRLRSLSFWRIIVIAALCLSLIPLLWISFYNHTSGADDCLLSMETHQVWLDSHDVLQIIGAAARTAYDYYLTWQGSYAANFLFALQPAVFDENLYFLATFVLIGVFLLCNGYFFRKILREIFHLSDNRLADIISGVVALMSIQLMPSPVQGFFWWNGAAYYMIFYALMLIYMANLFVAAYQGRYTAKRMTVLLLTAFFVAGGNLVTGLVTAEITALILLYTLCRKRAIALQTGLVFLTFVVCFALNAFAPGTEVRLSTRWNNLSPLQTVVQSYASAIRYGSEWTEPILIVGLLFLLPFLWRLPVEKLLPKKAPLALMLFFLFSLFASAFAPTLYVRYNDPGRIQNIRYFFWVFLCVVAALTIIGIGKRMLHTSDQTGYDWQGLAHKINVRYLPSYFVSILLVLALLGGYHMLIDNTNRFTSAAALRSLYKGEAQRYDQDVEERIQILRAGGDGAEYSMIVDPPYVLFLDDIWKNQDVIAFYQQTPRK
ncbi:MAG: hypothetical protein PHI98_06815 [Eubacteriales bacterium]|nr:hypothetical protein [Eubacteriales bacterium]